MDSRKNLDEVSFLRPILIILMVLYHCMAIHVGSWDLPEGLTVIPTYKEIGKLAYSFMLEAFVFVSGYVWAFQRESLGRKDNIYSLCWKKFLRLILPTILFGIPYLMLFQRDKMSVLCVLEGPGHLWFLPMLFWCFMIGWCILNIKISPSVVLSMLYCICLIRPAGLPLRLSYTLYYLPFFFLGYYLFSMYDKLKARITIGYLIAFWLLYLFVYLVYQVLAIYCSLGYRISQLFTIVYASIGTFALFASSIYVTNKHILKKWYIDVGTLCMGVYVFQQFIIYGIYYSNSVIIRTHEYAMPWFTFLIALTVSIFLTFIFRKSKIGRLLL